MFENIKEFSAEQIETRANEIKAEIDNADATKLDELNEELKALEARKAELEMETRKANMKAVAEGAGVVIAKAEVKEERTLDSVRGSEAYVNAFAEYLKTGDDRECRALMTDLVSGGSVPIPTVIDDYINTAWENARLLSRVRRTSIKGTAKYPFEFSATGAFAHTEGAPLLMRLSHSRVRHSLTMCGMKSRRESSSLQTQHSSMLSRTLRRLLHSQQQVFVHLLLRLSMHQPSSMHLHSLRMRQQIP